MPFATYWNNECLDHMLNDGSYTAPTIYVFVSRADPTADGSGIDEPSTDDAYARVETSAGDWNAAASSSKTNGNAITFPQATGSWGTLTHFGFADASSGGNVLAYAALSSSQAVASGSTVRFPASTLTVTGA